MESQKSEPFFKPRKIKYDDLYGKEGYILGQIQPNIFQFASKGAGSNIYLVIGENLNVLIDTGIISKFNSFNYLLTSEIGLKVEDIDLIINTHEHFDHLSANSYFHCPVAAHRWAAVKIMSNDELIMKGKRWGVDLTNLRVNIWLEDRNIFDIGTNILQVIETPGHTSGSICVYEPNKFFIFTGDTLFKNATTNIYESGSISEYINSLQILNTLKIKNFHPGHGLSVFGENQVKQELESSIENAKLELDAYINRIKSKPLEKSKPPPSLYKRKTLDL